MDLLQLFFQKWKGKRNHPASTKIIAAMSTCGTSALSPWKRPRLRTGTDRQRRKRARLTRSRRAEQHWNRDGSGHYGASAHDQVNYAKGT